MVMMSGITYRIADIRALDDSLTHQDAPLQFAGDLAVDHVLEALHKLVVHSHVSRNDDHHQHFPEELPRRWTIDEHGEPVRPHDLHHERIVHVFEHGLVVVHDRQWCLGVPLEKRVRSVQGRGGSGLAGHTMNALFRPGCPTS